MDAKFTLKAKFTPRCKLHTWGGGKLMQLKTGLCPLLPTAGLPDGMFSNQKSQFVNFTNLAMEDVSIFCGH
jgi:hypothetical protein